MSEKLPLLYQIQAEGGIRIGGAHCGQRMTAEQYMQLADDEKPVIVDCSEASAIWHEHAQQRRYIDIVEASCGVGRVASVSPFTVASFEFPLEFRNGQPNGRAAVLAATAPAEFLRTRIPHVDVSTPFGRTMLRLLRNDLSASVSMSRVVVAAKEICGGPPILVPITVLQSYDNSGKRIGVRIESMLFAPGSKDPEPSDELKPLGYKVTGIANIACAFMHCRGVPIEATEPSPARRKWHRRMRVPAVKEYVLRVAGCTPGGRSSGEGDSTEPGRALHLCRGHFANYTAERPLFGKHVGQFWIPQHTRGSATFGEVRKSYVATQPAARG